MSMDGPRMTADGATVDGSMADGAMSGGDDGSQGLVYYAVDDSQRWTFLSASTVVSGFTTYSGGVFDGRYLYFVPQFNPPGVLRYDTKASFTNPASWTAFVPTQSIFSAGGAGSGTYLYGGGTFDGRYLYLAPSGANTYLVRYDTQQPFAQDASWSAFNAATLDSTASYSGAVSDGRYTYFVPNKTTKVIVYDNTASDAGVAFTAASSFSAYDLGTGNTGFTGGVFDGTYVYFAPSNGSVAARHDTQSPIMSAWDIGSTGFDLGASFGLGPATHFWGGAYDGSRVYLTPNATQSWTLAAYTTSGTFGASSGWSVCALNPGVVGFSASSAFVGAAFDGRRLFLVPSGKPTGAAALPVVAYDTTQPFCPANLSSTYSKFDPTTLPGGANAAGFQGAAFDGHYVYFIPHDNGVVARFEAKSVNDGLAPPSYAGSWW